MFHSGGNCHLVTEISRKPYDSDATVTGLQLPENTWGGIGASVIYVNDFEVHRKTFEHRYEAAIRLVKDFLLVCAWNYDRK
jgi:hypothetical protein